jgi:hypothetical protein
LFSGGGIRVFGGGVGFLTEPPTTTKDRLRINEVVPSDNREAEIFYAGAAAGSAIIYVLVQVRLIQPQITID